jgi:apolipoprotein N-acyltransferase
VIWTGLEYFRSELYYLRFSWLNIGYSLSNFNYNPFDVFGMYGVGFVLFAVVSVVSHRHLLKRVSLWWVNAVFLLLIGLAFFLELGTAVRTEYGKSLSIAGIQTEFPSPGTLAKILDKALGKNPDAQIFVLSEYTLDGPVPDSLKDWCREHRRFLVVGGKDPVGTNDYYNTAFVVGTNGEVVFQQAKCVPIQFFKDGVPAPKQAVWNSPWGKIGICICYDLSYARVTDQLIRLGAQAIIVPTMDVAEWGQHQHELHARVAPVRAAEYGVPIFRLASSGISQCVDRVGRVTASAPFPGPQAILSGRLILAQPGSLPFDRWLAPFATGAMAAMILWFLFSRSAQASTANTQHPEKSQISTSKTGQLVDFLAAWKVFISVPATRRAGIIETCRLGFLWMLKLGCWNFQSIIARKTNRE